MVAKKTMCAFYSTNCSDFHEPIREFREEVIVKLMKERDVEMVFEFFEGSSRLNAG